MTPLLEDAIEPRRSVEPTKIERPSETNSVPKVGPASAAILKPAPPVVPTHALNQWISWETWSQANGFGKPQRVAGATNLSFRVKNTDAQLAITIGSPLARWNGVSLELAFAPQFTNGQPYVHALDALKNFDPLTANHPRLCGTNRTIVIDPGHGGENTGARCVCNKSFEKHYALDWALRLRPLLEARGWKVCLTRTNDIDVALSNRVAFAESVQADLFLSLHFNSSNSGINNRHESGGLETYCLTPAGMPSTLTRQFDDPRFRTYPNNAYDAQNLQYALRVHRALVEATAQRDRGVRRARFMTVLQGQNRPAVLVEGGYLSDPKEARLIATPSYRQKLAEAVAKALTD
ncbi:MAG: N-acetylmuramoyl-L-alanine amidase [Verrucomicrobiales bacterium]|nr:N-acetylmuramoyl-L-alanine amidase [Verrucomicrobiales bacterium]